MIDPTPQTPATEIQAPETSETEADFGPINQTGFSSEEPMYEQPPVVIDPNAPIVTAKQPWFKSRKTLLLITAGVVGLLLILLLLAATMRRQTPLIPSDAFSHPSPSPVLSPEEQKVTDLKNELNAADPTKQELTYPPVLSNISIPSPKPQ